MSTMRKAKKRKLSELSKDKIEDESDSIIELNVGGFHFITCKSTLSMNVRAELSEKPSYFTKRFGGPQIDGPKHQGKFFVDRNGENFKYVLNFLRNDECKKR